MDIYIGIFGAEDIATLGNTFPNTGTLQNLLLQWLGVYGGALLVQCLARFHASNRGKIGKLAAPDFLIISSGSA